MIEYMQLMTPERVMALLGPGATQSGISGPGGTRQVISAQSLAAALTAGLPRCKYLAARWIYVRDGTVARELYTVLYQKASLRLLQTRQPPSKALVCDYCELAMVEALDPHRFEQREDRRNWLKLNIKAWRRRASQYDVVYRMLMCWAADALDAIASNAAHK